MNPADWKLVRHPPTTNRSLQAHDAADTLVLAELGSTSLDRVMVVNDGFGGLSIPLVGAGAEVVAWGDSVLAEAAVARNLAQQRIGRATPFSSWPPLHVPPDDSMPC